MLRCRHSTVPEQFPGDRLRGRRPLRGSDSLWPNGRRGGRSGPHDLPPRTAGPRLPAMPPDRPQTPAPNRRCPGSEGARLRAGRATRNLAGPDSPAPGALEGQAGSIPPRCLRLSPRNFSSGSLPASSAARSCIPPCRVWSWPSDGTVTRTMCGNSGTWAAPKAYRGNSGWRQARQAVCPDAAPLMGRSSRARTTAASSSARPRQGG